jgi:hypothetical protein
VCSLFDELFALEEYRWYEMQSCINRTNEDEDILEAPDFCLNARIFPRMHKSTTVDLIQIEIPPFDNL